MKRGEVNISGWGWYPGGNCGKQIYYTKYFESNRNKIKNTWKGIKTIISIKYITTTIPHSIAFNIRTIANPTGVSNVFNNCFTSVTEKTKSNITFLPKNYTYYLSNTNTNVFFLTPTDKNKIFIISSLDSHKSSVPNTMPVKILELLKNDISQQLMIFLMSFLTGQFPSVLKIVKVIPIHKKNLKLIVQIRDQYTFNLIWKRLLKSSCTRDSLIFGISTIWYTLYNLAFNKNTWLPMLWLNLLRVLGKLW